MWRRDLEEWVEDRAWKTEVGESGVGEHDDTHEERVGEHGNTSLCAH